MDWIEPIPTVGAGTVLFKRLPGRFILELPGWILWARGESLREELRFWPGEDVQEAPLETILRRQGAPITVGPKLVIYHLDGSTGPSRVFLSLRNNGWELAFRGL